MTRDSSNVGHNYNLGIPRHFSHILATHIIKLILENGGNYVVPQGLIGLRFGVDTDSRLNIELESSLSIHLLFSIPT